MNEDQTSPDPFGPTASASLYVPREATDEAFAVLRRAVLDESRVALIEGPAGLGKTLLLRRLEEAARERFRPLYLPYVALAPEELCHLILQTLSGGSVDLPTKMLAAWIGHLQSEDSALVLLLDDATALPGDTARWLARMLDESKGGLRLALAVLDPPGSSELRVLSAKAERIRLVAPMSLKETRAYLEARLEIGGAKDKIAAFDDGVIERLHRISRGNPRRLHWAADVVLRGADPAAIAAFLDGVDPAREARDDAAPPPAAKKPDGASQPRPKAPPAEESLLPKPKPKPAAKAEVPKVAAGGGPKPANDEVTQPLRAKVPEDRVRPPAPGAKRDPRRDPVEPPKPIQSPSPLEQALNRDAGVVQGLAAGDAKAKPPVAPKPVEVKQAPAPKPEEPKPATANKPAAAKPTAPPPEAKQPTKPAAAKPDPAAPSEPEKPATAAKAPERAKPTAPPAKAKQPTKPAAPPAAATEEPAKPTAPPGKAQPSEPPTPFGAVRLRTVAVPPVESDLDLPTDFAPISPPATATPPPPAPETESAPALRADARKAAADSLREATEGLREATSALRAPNVASASDAMAFRDAIGALRGAIAAAEEAAGAKASEEPPPRARRRRAESSLPRFAALLGLLAVSGVVGGLVLGGMLKGGTDGADVAVEEPAPPPSVTDVVERAGAEIVEPTPPDPEPVVAKPASLPPAPEPVVAAVPEPVREPVLPEPQPLVREQAPPRPATPEPAPAPTVHRIGINATPWATIVIDGEEVGETPLAGVALTEGVHRVEAHMPDGRIVERQVRIGPDTRSLVFP